MNNERHTPDAIDFCLSLALTQGATREYYKSIEKPIEPFFEPTERSGLGHPTGLGVS